MPVDPPSSSAGDTWHVATIFLVKYNLTRERISDSPRAQALLPLLADPDLDARSPGMWPQSFW